MFILTPGRPYIVIYKKNTYIYSKEIINYFKNIKKKKKSKIKIR